jgi:hypothetical protein
MPEYPGMHPLRRLLNDIGYFAFVSVGIVLLAVAVIAGGVGLGFGIFWLVAYAPITHFHYGPWDAVFDAVVVIVLAMLIVMFQGRRRRRVTEARPAG